eukprot:jgi/Hompol1/1837/HPOL_005743-RA
MIVSLASSLVLSLAITGVAADASGIHPDNLVAGVVSNTPAKLETVKVVAAGKQSSSIPFSAAPRQVSKAGGTTSSPTPDKGMTLLAQVGIGSQNA